MNCIFFGGDEPSVRCRDGRHSLIPFADKAVWKPTMQFCSGGGVGLPASKFCLTLVHERGSVKRFDESRVIHMLSIFCRGRGKTLDSGCRSGFGGIGLSVSMF